MMSGEAVSGSGDQVSTTAAKFIPNARLARLRIGRGWTQEQVAGAIADLAAMHGKATGISANAVSRLERGYCSWPHSLVAEFEELFDCAATDLGFVNRRVGGARRPRADPLQESPDVLESATDSHEDVRPPESVSEVLSPDIYSPNLAAYGTPQLYILANNPEYRRTFPGIAIGTNLLEWVALNPLARDVMVEWDLEAQVLGNSIRQVACDPRNGEARAVLRRCLNESPDFAAIYKNGDFDVRRPHPYQLLRDLDTGIVRRVDCTIWVANTNGAPVHFYVGKPLREIELA